MNVISRVSVFALGPVVGAACRVVGLSVAADGAAVVSRFLKERFTDQSLRVTDALSRASERAWRALELALDRESVLTAADRADDRAFREQVRDLILDSQFDGARCLAELRVARNRGVLGGDADPTAVAVRLGDLTRFGDPAAQVAAQWTLADELAADFAARGFTALAAFVALRPADDPTAEPLLAVAVRYYFRRAVEEDPRLFQGLAFAQLDRIGRAQESGAAALAGVAASLDALHTTLRDRDLPLADEIVEVPVPSIADRFRDQTNGVVAASPDGSRVLGGSRYDGKLRLFDARTGKELRRLPGHAGWVTCIAFSADGARALSGGADGAVKLWDVASGKLLRTWPCNGTKPVAVAFTADGQAQSRCAAGTIHIFG